MNKEVSILLQRIFILLMFSYFLFASTLSYALPIPGLPFNIVTAPGTTLPTTVVAGSTATAFYTVSNNTLEQRNTNFVKYLPPNVAQDTGVGSTCGVTFNLAPQGQAGDTCILKLTVFGPVNAADPDPHNHLFVCFPGGITCAGTVNSLNVKLLTLASITVIPITATINVGSNLQYTAIATYSDGSMANITTAVTWSSLNPAVATIGASTGLAHGVSVGMTMISATQMGVSSNSATLNVINPIVSIDVTPHTFTLHLGAPPPNNQKQYTAMATLGDGSTVDITNTANWFSSVPGVASITPGPNGGLATAVSAGTTNIIATQGGVTSNAALLTVDNPLVSIAVTPLAATVAVSNTQQFTATGTFSDGTTQNITTSVTWISSNTAVATITSGAGGGLATGVSVGTSNITATMGSITSSPVAVLTVTSTLFVVNTNGTISYCSVASNGSFTCLQNSLVANPQQIAINPAGTFAYVTTTVNTVFVCTINTLTGFSSCTQTATTTTFSGLGPITVNPTNTFAYTADTNHVYRCVINATDGTLSACSPTDSSLPAAASGLAVNPAGTFIYTTIGSLFAQPNVYFCAIDATTGALFPCTSTGSINTFNPIGIVIKGGFAYIANNADSGANAVTACVVDNAGTLSSCTATGGAVAFLNPKGIAINFAGTFAYVSNTPANNVFYCGVSGLSLSCNGPIADGFAAPFGIAIH